MKYGYARVSTDDQNPALQLAALKKGRRSVLKRSAFVLASLSLPSWCQSAQAPYHFEVASVRQAEAHGSVRRRGPGRISYEGIPMSDLLTKVYDVPAYQIVWPSWALGAHYTILATMASGTTDEALRRMLETLLIERFHLTIHREIRDLLVYEVRVSDAGLRMREAVTPSDDVVSPTIFSDDERREAINFETVGRVTITDESMHYVGNYTVKRLGTVLGKYLDHPLADRTGLKKYYAIDLTWNWSPRMVPPPVLGMGQVPASDNDAKSLFAVMEKKLGLTVQLRKVPTEYIVIDHLDRVPTEN